MGRPRTPEAHPEWPKPGDRVVSVMADGPDPMQGTAEKIISGQLPAVRVRWDNGEIGRHTITTLKRI